MGSVFPCLWAYSVFLLLPPCLLHTHVWQGTDSEWLPTGSGASVPHQGEAAWVTSQRAQVPTPALLLLFTGSVYLSVYKRVMLSDV